MHLQQDLYDLDVEIYRPQVPVTGEEAMDIYKWEN